MAKVIGAVRFADGELRFFIYNMCGDVARPRLFLTQEETSDAWDDPQTDAYDRWKTFPDEGQGEVVDVMPWYGFDDQQVTWSTRVDRDLMLITGPVSEEHAVLVASELQHQRQLHAESEVALEGEVLPPDREERLRPLSTLELANLQGFTVDSAPIVYGSPDCAGMSTPIQSSRPSLNGQTRLVGDA